MPRNKPFKPTEKDFFHAYQLKMNGFTDAKIAEALGVSSVTYSLHRLKFLQYFARKRREAERVSRVGAGVGRPQGSSNLEKYRTAAVKLAELGENQRQIANTLGIPPSTLQSWMEMDETFGHEIRSAKDKADQMVIRALLRRCTGFTTREATSTEMRIGTALAQRTTTRRVSRVLPSVKAIELWLTNQRKWLSENAGDGEKQTDDRPVEYEIVDGLFNEQPQMQSTPPEENTNAENN